MEMPGFALFQTQIGTCGVAWSAAGLLGVLLPGPSEAATRRLLTERFAQAHEIEPPREVKRAIAEMTALLDGEPRDLSQIALDYARVSPFPRRVYEAARRISVGQTLTYGELARRVGSPGAARAVGRALGLNPFPIVVPCHRVLAAGGKIGGFSAEGGPETKRRMLAIEARAVA